MGRRLSVSVMVLAGALAAFGMAGAADKPKFGTWGYDPASMDRQVKPGDDFFDYVNGGWAKRTEIAPDRTSAGVDVVLTDEAERQVRDMAEQLAKNPSAGGPTGRQIGDLYAAWMDEAGVEARGASVLHPYLARIDAVKDKAGLMALFAAPGYESPVDFGIQNDPDQPTRYLVNLSQGGLGMPNRDYYLLQGAKYDAYRTAYKAYIAKTLSLAGIVNAQAKAEAIYALEARIAKAHWAPEKTRDVDATHNPMDGAKLTALSPQFDWGVVLEDSGIPGPLRVNVDEPDVIKTISAELTSTPLSVWKDYEAFHFISDHAIYLPKAFDQARFDFYSKTLRDVPQQRERWKRGVQLINSDLGEAVGRLYVEKYYPPEAEKQADELVANLKAAYSERFEHNTWMDPDTKKQALAKLATFDPRLGHPKKYIDYSSLKIDRNDLLGDAIRSGEFEWKLWLSRYPKPVDRSLWDMVPQEVNAYYDPLTNQITFPAAILQPPYFDPKADPAANYGGEGAVIGHEMGHGFDDQGRHFDGSGKLHDWWTAGSAKAFAARTAALGKQFDSYEPVPGVHIKGDLTMGENIGDLGGLEAAYAAWRRYVAQHGEPPVIDGLTGDQRFFIAYAQSWQDKTREGALRQQLLTNPHSPAKYRVNGIVRNVDAWYAAFNVRPGDKLYLPPDQRVHIW
ncbi:MAG TPA: M13 family metallopeptidase [Caulobacteraceae bacterium]|nr:M13 family metallopeptidase [Caulobacteraceae bacterium]